MSIFSRISEFINNTINRVYSKIKSVISTDKKSISDIDRDEDRLEKDDIPDLKIKDLDIGQITDIFKISDVIPIDETEGDTSIKDTEPTLLDSSSDISDDNLTRLTNFDNKTGYEEFLKKVSEYKIR